MIFIGNSCVMDAIEAAMCKAQVKELKDKQKLSLITFIQGKELFISLPTGYSMIYGLLPETFNFLKSQYCISHDNYTLQSKNSY